MPDEPQISVIVPVYNRSELVRRAVGSLLDQDIDVPYEIVVVDDGSTDGSGDAVCGMDPRVRVLFQPNQGAPAARHNGISQARAPVVAFLDSDDFAPRCKLSALWGALNGHQDCIAAFGVTQRQGIPRGDADRWTDCPLDGRTIVIDDAFETMLGECRPVAAAMNLMTYRNPALAASRDRTFYRGSEDYDLQLRLACRNRFVFIASVTCIYEPVPEGVTGALGPVKQGTLALCAARDAFVHAPECAPLRATMRRRVEMEWASLAVGLALRKDWRLFWKVLAIAVRQVWWAMDTAVEAKPEVLAGCLVRAVKCGRTLRALQQRPSHDDIK
jgi:glycosyltransferase involved in cell wall biosynthesis